MTQADADAVFAAGWNDQALHDAVSTCALFNFMNRLVEGHGIKTRSGVFSAGRQSAFMMAAIAACCGCLGL